MLLAEYCGPGLRVDKGYRQDCANTFLLRQNNNKKKSFLRNSSTRNSFEETSSSSDFSWKLVQNTTSQTESLFTG